jgi:hypothetical protein
MEVLDLLKLIRYFCVYFNSRLKKLSDMQFRQFYASKKFNDEFLTIWNEGNFGDERGKLSAGNFLITVFKLFDELDKFDIGSLNLHLDKENNVIFSFLTNNLTKKNAATKTNTQAAQQLALLLNGFVLVYNYLCK